MVTLVTVAPTELFGAIARPSAASWLSTVTPASPTPFAPTAAGTYTVTVDNVGNRTAKDSTVVIDLPVTQTSPQVYVMGVVSGLPSSVTVVGVCSGIGSPA